MAGASPAMTSAVRKLLTPAAMPGCGVDGQTIASQLRGMQWRQPLIDAPAKVIYIM
jgi:hypothetical protein